MFRNPAMFKAAAAIVPVTNLFQRLAWKGVERQRALMDPHNRFGGSPAEQPEVYRERSPLFQVDRLQIPLLVHVARNDEDVNIEEEMQLVDALRARKPPLAETKVYENPPGGHTFDRRVDPRTLAAGEHAGAAGFVEARLGVPRLAADSTMRQAPPQPQRDVFTAITTLCVE